MVGEPLLAPSAYGKIRGQESKRERKRGAGRRKGGNEDGKREEIKLIFYREPISASQNYLFTGAELLANHFARL